MPKKLQRGYTLLEALIAVFVMTVLVTVAIPSFLDMLDRQRLKGASQSLFSFLYLAKSEAVSSNTNVYVVFNSSEWCAGVSTSNSCDCTSASSCQINGVDRVIDGDDFDGITISNIAFANGNYTGFEPTRTSANGDNGALLLTDGTDSVMISVSSLGRISMCQTGSTTLGISEC